jgi:hypothetical protein
LDAPEIGLVELSLEMLCFRQLKDELLDAHRSQAVEAIAMERKYAGRGDADGTYRRSARPPIGATAIEIEAPLARGGFDNIEINVRMFL